MDNRLELTIKKLENLFSKTNEKFFNNGLEKPMITLNHNQNKKRLAYGWCTVQKVWKDTAKKTDGYYEINICSDYLNRDIKEVIATLIHEMVHLDNIKHGIQDTSRTGTYHNKKYKETAEKHGLNIEKSDKYGWTVTTLQEDTIKWVEALTDDEKELMFYRANEKELGKAKKNKQSSKLYICPICGTKVRATKLVNLICGDCLVKMECEGETNETDEGGED